MKNRRRNREAFAEHSYWQSYSDMMAALLLIFILLIAITLAIYRQKTSDLDQTRLALNAAQSELDATIEDLELSKAELEKSNGELASSLAELQQAYAQAALTQEELNNAYLEIENARQELTTTKQELQDIVGIRTDIIGALQTAFSNSTMKVDAQTGSITFSSDVLFRYNSASLTAESRETLKNIIPMYLDVLLQDQFRGYIAEIIIEGHTDTGLPEQYGTVLRARQRCGGFLPEQKQRAQRGEDRTAAKTPDRQRKVVEHSCLSERCRGKSDRRGGHAGFQEGGDQIPSEGG